MKAHFSENQIVDIFNLAKVQIGDTDLTTIKNSENGVHDMGQTMFLCTGSREMEGPAGRACG